MLIHRHIHVDSQAVDRELDGLLDGLPDWRRRYALSYRRPMDRYLCAKSYLVLSEILSENFGIQGKPEFRYNSYGKPLLKDYPDIHFNFSHCTGGILCAIADEAVGVDIENIQFDDDLARTVLSDEEYQDVLSSADPGIRFTEYWTMKESGLKLEGTGLTDDMKSSLKTGGNISYRLFRDEKHGLVSCIALRSPKH